MKYNFIYALCTLPLMAMGLASCNTESMEADVVSSEKLLAGTTLDVSGSASTGNVIPVEANCGWKVSSDVSWITITKPEAGLGNGSGNVVFDVVESMLSTEQTGHLTIKTDGGMPRIVTITQRAGNIWLRVTPSSLYYTYEGGNQSIQVVCNSAYSVTSSAEWLKVDDETSLTAEGDKTFTIHAEPNNNPEGMTAVITIADVDHKADIVTIPVEIGSKNPMLTLTAANDVPAVGGTVTFGVVSNFEWRATITQLQPQGDAQWATFNAGTMQCSGEPSGEPAPVVVTVMPNTSEAERVVTILAETQSTVGINKTQQLEIRQAAATAPVVYTPYAASVGMTEATLSFSATSSSFDITRCGIIYSTNSENVRSGTRIEGTINGENATATLPNLQPGTIYYATAYAISAVGEAYSEVMSFKTRLTPGRDSNPTP